jgi:hypothetical protein
MKKNLLSAAQSHRTKPPFWFDFGRLIFPDLISHPRAMHRRMIAIALVLMALLVGGTAGFFYRASNTAELLQIQARELDR